MALFKFEIYRDLATHDLVINLRITEREIYNAEKMMAPAERDLFHLAGQGSPANRFYWLAEVARWSAIN